MHNELPELIREFGQRHRLLAHRVFLDISFGDPLGQRPSDSFANHDGKHHHDDADHEQ